MRANDVGNSQCIPYAAGNSDHTNWNRFHFEYYIYVGRSTHTHLFIFSGNQFNFIFSRGGKTALPLYYLLFFPYFIDIGEPMPRHARSIVIINFLSLLGL